MSTTPVQAGNALGQLASTLFKSYDVNGDGRLDADEFSTLVAKLTGALAPAAAGQASAATSPSYASRALPASASPRAVRARLEGFDHAKLADTAHRTQKYIFARVAQQTDLTSVTDKASAEAVLRSMVPSLQSAGLEVLDVKGDKIKVVGQHSGREVWIDVIRGANSATPAFQWLPIET
jgi:hypothetical protein